MENKPAASNGGSLWKKLCSSLPLVKALGETSSSLIYKKKTTSEQELLASRKLQRRGSHLIELPKYVLDPHSKFVRRWEIFNLSVILYCVLVYPYRLAFGDNDANSYTIVIDGSADLFMILDFVLPFFVAIYKHGVLITCRKQIIFSYLKGRFCFQLIACIPFAVLTSVYNTVVGDNSVAVSVLRLVRLVKIRDVNKQFSLLEKNTKFPYSLARILRFITIIVFQAHMMGCMWWFLARAKDFNEDTWVYAYDRTLPDRTNLSKYIRCMYWAFVTLCTVGYGEIHPNNDMECLFVIFSLICNLAVSSYIVGNMSALATSLDQGTSEFRARMGAVINFMMYQKFPASLQNKLITYRQMMFDGRDRTPRELDMEHLPFSLRLDVADHLYRTTLQRVPLFHGCSIRFLTYFALLLKEQTYQTGNTIMQAGDTVREMYIVGEGRVELSFARTDKTVSRILSKGDNFGEVAFLFGTYFIFSARAVTNCTVYVVEKAGFDDITKHHHHELDKIRRNALKLSRQHLGKDFEAVQAIIRQVSLEKLSELMYSVSADDVMKVRDLLDQGIDVNGQDYDGRSALHVAVADGLVRMTQFLLEKGADTTVKDRYGATPLSNAHRFGRVRIAQILREYHAPLGDDDPPPLPDVDMDMSTQRSRTSRIALDYLLEDDPDENNPDTARDDPGIPSAKDPDGGQNSSSASDVAELSGGHDEVELENELRRLSILSNQHRGSLLPFAGSSKSPLARHASGQAHLHSQSHGDPSAAVHKRTRSSVSTSDSGWTIAQKGSGDGSGSNSDGGGEMGRANRVSPAAGGNGVARQSPRLADSSKAPSTDPIFTLQSLPTAAQFARPSLRPSPVPLLPNVRSLSTALDLESCSPHRSQDDQHPAQPSVPGSVPGSAPGSGPHRRPSTLTSSSSDSDSDSSADAPAARARPNKTMAVQKQLQFQSRNNSDQTLADGAPAPDGLVANGDGRPDANKVRPLRANFGGGGGGGHGHIQPPTGPAAPPLPPRRKHHHHARHAHRSDSDSDAEDGTPSGKAAAVSRSGGGSAGVSSGCMTARGLGAKTMQLFKDMDAMSADFLPAAAAASGASSSLRHRRQSRVESNINVSVSSKQGHSHSAHLGSNSNSFTRHSAHPRLRRISLLHALPPPTSPSAIGQPPPVVPGASPKMLLVPDNVSWPDFLRLAGQRLGIAAVRAYNRHGIEFDNASFLLNDDLIYLTHATTPSTVDPLSSSAFAPALPPNPPFKSPSQRLPPLSSRSSSSPRHQPTTVPAH